MKLTKSKLREIIREELLNEAFDTGAVLIHNTIEKHLKKYYGKDAEVRGINPKSGKSKIIVSLKSSIHGDAYTTRSKDYLIKIEPQQ